MKRGVTRSLAWACWCSALVLVACGGQDSVYQPPVLGSQGSELVEIRGNIDFGEVRTGQSYSKEKLLTGFVFDAFAGARVNSTLKSNNGEKPVLLLYGPADEKGAWGQAIAMDANGSEQFDAILRNVDLKKSGRYLLAVGSLTGVASGVFDLTLGCIGNCEEPPCEDVACDLYCPAGFMVDPNGCPICRCAEGECQSDEDCFDLFPWASRDSLRCVEGRCEEQELVCDENTPCPDGYHCQFDLCADMPCAEGEQCPPCSGRCVPDQQGVCNSDADCPDGLVCAIACPAPEDGTDPGVPGECFGTCVPVTVECQADSDCPPDQVCVISCWDCDPDMPPCECDPDVDPNCDCRDCVPGCVGHCVQQPQPECRSDADCPEGMYCAMECWEAGCDPATGECPPCEVDPENPNGGCLPVCRGYCLPIEPHECQSDLDCVTPTGEQMRCVNGNCVPADCSCIEIYDPVCAQKCSEQCDPNGECTGMCEVLTYPNECFAACDGAEILYPGECDRPRECQSDFDCVDEAGNTGRCLDGVCVFGSEYCHADWECAPGYSCDIFECDPSCLDTGRPVDECCVGVCVAEAQCRTDEDCAIDCDPNSQDCWPYQGRCIDGRCVFDEPCACPEVWDPVCAVVCPPCMNEDPPCEAPCVEQTFSNACFAECEGAQVIHAGECGQPPPECLVDADCPPGTYCEHCIGPDGTMGPCTEYGVCLPVPDEACTADADCPEGFRCELECIPGCEGGPTGQGCCNGRCVPAESQCIVTGCSGQVCAPEPVNTTCEWRPEYECLRYSNCTFVQREDGTVGCGWEQTPEFLECMAQFENGGNECQADSDCAAGQVCVVSCDASGQCTAICKQADCICPEYYEPVCGADGNTYDNICFLDCAGVELMFPGPC